MAKDFLSNNKKFNLYNPDPVIFDYFEILVLHEIM